MAGLTVEVKAAEFSSKGDDELVEIKYEDEISQIEKKYLHVDILSKEDETPNIDSPYSVEPNVNNLQNKIQKAILDLESIKNDISNTSVSSDTVSSVLTSLNGMLNSIKQDELK